jgi:hypothetical protein
MEDRAQARTPVAILGTLAEFHREPIPYDLQALIRLVAALHPDLLCLELTINQWQRGFSHLRQDMRRPCCRWQAPVPGTPGKATDRVVRRYSTIQRGRAAGSGGRQCVPIRHQLKQYAEAETRAFDRL